MELFGDEGGEILIGSLAGEAMRVGGVHVGVFDWVWEWREGFLLVSERGGYFGKVETWGL